MSCIHSIKCMHNLYMQVLCPSNFQCHKSLWYIFPSSLYLLGYICMTVYVETVPFGLSSIKRIFLHIIFQDTIFNFDLRQVGAKYPTIDKIVFTFNWQFC